MHKNLLRLALLAVLSALALAFAACGEDDSDSGESADLGPDPVAMAPADAPFYTEIVVRPEGDLGDDLNSALSKLLGEEDPGATVIEALDRELASDPENGGVTYASDIEPWLGSRAGFFVSGYDASAEEADAAAAIAVTDAEAAQTFIDKVNEGEGDPVSDETYEGVDYTYLSEEDTAYGISGDFMVVGNRTGFEAAIDASAGDSLEDNADATTALDDAPDNSVFSLYVDTAAVVDLVEQSGGLDQAEQAQLDSVIGQFGEGAIEAWGTVTDSTFALGGSAPSAEGAGEPSDLVASFPSDAWLAFASADVGEQLQTQIDQFRTGFEAGFESQAPPGIEASEFDPLAQIEQSTGLDLENDFAWIGDAGGFVEGSSILGLGGGLVLEATDEAQASDTLGKLQSALEGARELRGQVQISPSSSGDGFSIQAQGGLPIGAEVALQEGKVVAAIGADTIDDVISPSETLADSDRFSTASDALGAATPSFFLDFGPVVELVESTGQATSDPEYQMAKPYLDALDFLVSGSTVEGDRTTGSVVLGVKEASSTETAAAVITP